MTPSELKRKYQEANPDGHYFDRSTMRFFGDTMQNYGVRRYGSGWELYRRNPVKEGFSGSEYFTADFRLTRKPASLLES